MRRKIAPLILVLAFLLAGCFGTKSENGVKSSGVKVIAQENEKIVISDAEVIGGEFEIKPAVNKSDIVAGEGVMVIVTEEKGVTKVTAAGSDGKIAKEELLFKIKGEHEIDEIKLTESITVENLEKKSKEAAKKGETRGKNSRFRAISSDMLLGDFNNDNSVNMSDFALFIDEFNGGNVLYDIAPAEKGSTGDWVNIYSKRTGDGAVDLLDFIIFAQNYGKTIVTDITVTGANSVIAGETTILTADREVNWVSSNTAVATVSPAYGKSTTVTAVSAGAAEIVASINGKSKSFLINIIPKEQPVVSAVEISGAAVVESGKTALLTAVVKYSDGTTKSEAVEWTTSASTVATVTPAVGISTEVAGIKAGNAEITASKGGKSVTKSVTVTEPSGIVIYVEKPTAWAEIWIWYDADLTTAAWNTTALKSAPGDMVSYRTGWYKKEIAGTTEVQFLFNDGTWNNKLNKNGVDFKTTKSVWITKDGTMNTIDPVGPQPPKISVTPAGGYFATTVTPSITVAGDDQTTVQSAKYSIDGTDPKTNGTPFNLTASVAIGNGMADQEIKTLKVWAASKVNATGEILESTFTTTYTKGEQKVSLRLGAIYGSSGTKFAIWSPDSSNVVVNVDGKDYNCTKEADSSGYTNVYSVTVPGDLHLKEYQFKINGAAVKDPSGFMFNYDSGKNVVINMAATEPDGGWVARPEFKEREDAVIYEVHVRDFTMYNSGLDSAKKGKFLGMVQSGTTVNGVKSGIDHLKELGVTHVQILPFFDFNSTGYNWGYNPMNYNIPEENYCTDPKDFIKRIKETKTMINEFHKAGIRVVMDVVYNHTDVAAGLPSKYYFSDQRIDMSGCGSSINASEPMVSKFIQESLNFWTGEYKMDGFRFDLIGIFNYNEVNKWADSIYQNNPGQNILFYGEPWDGYYEGRGLPDAERSSRVRYGNMPAMAQYHVGVFNDKIRDGIRGNGDHIGTNYRGYMHGATGGEWNIKTAMTGSLLDSYSTSPLTNLWSFPYTADPEQTINYAAAHDNLCLWDKIIMEGFSGEQAKNMAKMAHGIVMSAQGIPFIHAGDEMCRTKGTDLEKAKNSYNAGDDINKIDWNWKAQNIDVFNFNKDIIAMRKSHAGFRMTTWNIIKSNVTSEVSGQAIITRINGEAVGDSWKKIIVVSNSNASTQYNLSLSGTWKVFAENGSTNVNRSVSGSINCAGPNITILYQE